MLTTIDSLGISFGVLAAQRNATREGPFPAAKNIIYGTAFAITPELFLTAGHVVENAASEGDVSLGRFGNPVEEGRFELAAEVEIFTEVDMALMRVSGLEPAVLPADFTPLAIFEKVRAIGFALGFDPEYHAYAPRGFAGHVVAGRQLFERPQQPFSYELSFVPPKGMSGAALIPQRPGTLRFAGIILGSNKVQLDGDVTRLGIAISVEELLRLKSRIVGGPLASVFGREPLPQRPRIGTVAERLMSELGEPDE